MTTEATPKMGYEGKAAQAQASLGDDLWDLHAAASKLSEFTAGRSLTAFEQTDVLQAVALSMLALMQDAANRIARQNPEVAARLAASGVSALLAPAEKHAPDYRQIWHFLQDDLPALLARATEELEAWHEA